MRGILFVSLLFLKTLGTAAYFYYGFSNDSDLTHYITRPEIKAPKYNVEIYNPDAVTPGYWFVAPYAALYNTSQLRNYYQACQTGPHIYDGNGELVWSGACLSENENAFDFRLWQKDDTTYLSAIYEDYGFTRGMGIVLNTSFEPAGFVHNEDTPRFNMHELNIIENGRTALYVIYKRDLVDTSDLGLEQDKGWVSNNGFRELDRNTGKTVFEWYPVGKVNLSTSSVRIANLEGSQGQSWNFFHVNSVDKNVDGDYLISSRFTDCIYKISGKNGSVIWRLGGTETSFVQEGFNFSKQHDARFIEQNATTTIISFLDNAADDSSSTSSYSSALIVALETTSTPMRARVVQRWIRPDEKLSRLRGNFQLLSNGNAFVGWSDNSYISEHSPSGELLMEARFKTSRFVTYRSYKFNFTGTPSESPALKAYVFGVSPQTSTTVCYVSWNGATEVAAWNFYGSNDTDTQNHLFGTSLKTGFETMYQWTGYQKFVFAEAVGKDGQSLGKSAIEATIIPQDWTSKYNFEEGLAGDSSLHVIDQQELPQQRKFAPYDFKQEL